MSKILYIRISDEDWQQIAEEAKQRETSMVRAAIRVLKRGIECPGGHDDHGKG